MALESIRVSLRAISRKGRINLLADFVERLGLPANDQYQKLFTESASRINGLLVLFEIEVADFGQLEDPWDELAKQFALRCAEVASWLNQRSPDTIKAFEADDLKVMLFFNMWISSDQIQLEIPQELLKACGRLSIPIELSSYQ